MQLIRFSVPVRFKARTSITFPEAPENLNEQVYFKKAYLSFGRRFGSYAICCNLLIRTANVIKP
jgi:hypothetical protein